MSLILMTWPKQGQSDVYKAAVRQPHYAMDCLFINLRRAELYVSDYPDLFVWLDKRCI
jgi:hypothetical protein